MTDARHWIEQLELQPHPEGGWYRETWRADVLVPTAHGERSAGTAILYLLERGQVSAFHRIRSDEVWLHHAGAGLQIPCLGAEGLTVQRLGLRSARGERPQVVVPAGNWFGARLDPGAEEHFALVSCTVAPGFDFADFEMASPDAMRAEFPDAEEWIEALSGA